MGNKVQWLYGASAAVLLAAGCITPAKAQNATQAFVVTTCGTPLTTLTAGKNGPVMENVTGQLCVNASVSASITGFPTVQSTGTPIAVTTGGVTGTLPTGAVVVASNVGATNGAYCKLGASASTSDQLIPPNSWFAFTVGANTQLTCITSASTTTVNMVGGSGLPTGSGGGGGGSGGGATNITQVGGVNIPTGGGLQSGALPVDASTSSQIHADLTGPVTACAAAPCVTTIGRVGIDNTVPGTTNGVTDVAAPLGGASSSYLQPTASDNHANIKNGAGTAYSVHTSNNSATKNYLRLYDAGTGFNGCNSATGIIFGMEIPPSDSGFSVILGGSKGLAFSTGLSICVTSGYGATDTTNATATAIMSNVIYK